MTTAAEKKKVALHERADALRIVEDWIHEHADEVLMNGGALPDELAALLAEADGDFDTKVERVAMKRRDLQGNAAQAKAQKDYFAQREKMWANADAGLRTYLQRALDVAGRDKVKTALATVWLQDNAPALQHEYDGEQLLAIAFDADVTAELARVELLEGNEAEPHPLARYITVTRSAALDTRTMLADYQARNASLQEEAAALELTDDETIAVLEDADDKISGEEEAGGADATAEWAAGVRQWHLDAALETKRAEHVRHGLAAAFPGVTVTHSQHVRQR